MRNVENIRNIGITAHIDAGKTTTTERILFYTGRNHKIGEVHDGAATMDWMAQEQERGITITSAVTACKWIRNDSDYLINIIDTPGHVDFTIEVERSLRILDGSIIVVCGVSGIQAQTETIWNQTKKYDIPNVVFINKLDRKGADYGRVLDEIKEKFDINPVLINYPVYDDEKILGIVDIVEGKLVKYSAKNMGYDVSTENIPDRFISGAKKKRDVLYEILSDFDDAFAEAFLSDAIIPVDTVKSLLRKTTIDKNLIPVCTGSAFKNKGVQSLINGICDFLPSPNDVKKETLVRKDKHVRVACKTLSRDPNDDFYGLIFKVYSDNYAGFLFYVRVYSGTLKPGMAVYNLNADKKDRVMKLFKMHANRREEIDWCGVGDICACVGLSISNTGDTLSEKNVPCLLKAMTVFNPVISFAVEAKSTEDAKKLNDALAKIDREDPSFYVEKNGETGQLIISGMGELHLDVVVQRLQTDFGVVVKTGKPQVSYRETITKKTFLREKVVKTIEGKTGQVLVDMEIRPIVGNDENITILNHNLSVQTAEKIETIVKELLKSGSISGYPLIKIAFTIKSLLVEPPDSPLMIISIILSQLIRKLLNSALPIMLEPVMKVDVNCLKTQMGDVIADLNGRVSKITEIVEKNESVMITCSAYLSGLFGYSTVLRSLTKGKGTYSMVFNHYDKLSNN